MKQSIILLIVLFSIGTISCSVQREQYGNYANQTGREIVNVKGKDIYLFWDQVQLQNVEKNLNT